jgi:alpha/beta superfamily hydrolase
MTQTETQTVQFTTSDGVTIDGDLRVPESSRAAAIICHPHPQYGGDRHNNVVQALFDALPAAGVAALRFDFRAEYDDGRGEGLDATAALDYLASAVPGVLLAATGYSFGAMIALGLDDTRVAAKVLAAPPLAAMPVKRGMDVATLVLTPAHDQFSAPDATEAIISDWPQTTHETIASADHFLVGRTAYIAERTVEFLLAAL